MPLSGLRIRCAKCAPFLALFLSVSTLVVGQSADAAGTLAEDYLPELKPILQSAVRQAPDVILKQIEIDRAEARIYDADRQRWPNVSGDISYNANQTAVSGNSNTQSRNSGLFYTVRANQALFYWGEIKNRGEVARIGVAIQQKEYAEAYRTLVRQLRQLYLELVARNASLRQMRFELTLREAQLATAREELRAGTLPAGEVAGKELELSERQVEVDRWQAQFDALRRTIGRLSGVGEIPADKVPVEIPLPRYDARVSSEMLAAMLRDAGKNTFQAQIAELQIQQAERNYRIARVRLLPKFEATAEHVRDSSTTASETSVSQTAIQRETIGIHGRWDIFDGFATKGAKLEARIARREAEKRLQVATDSAMAEAQSLERFASLDARSVQLSEQRRSGAEAGVKKAEEERAAGRVSKDAVDSALIGLRVAEAAATSARANFLSDWSSFVSLVGEDPVLNNLPSRYVRSSR